MTKALFILNNCPNYSNYFGYSSNNYSGYSSNNYSGYSSNNYSGYSSNNYSSNAEYSCVSQTTSGLYNSAKFIVDALLAEGGQAAVVYADDVNNLERLAALHNATDIFIEGLWVPPEFFEQIQTTTVRRWHVRIHSEIPFLAGENNAIAWITKYFRHGIRVVANAQRVHQQIRWLAKQTSGKTQGELLTPLLPNCYPTDFPQIPKKKDSREIHIGTFGAFRPLKNHLQQAFLAARYAESIGKQLFYHINFTDGQEHFADFQNVKAVLEAANQKLILHKMEDRETFLNTLTKMDLLLQVSMTETFNIVAADATLAGIPILISNEIPWAYPLYADPQDIDDSIKKLKLIMQSKTFFIQQNREGLKRHTKHALEEWLHYLDSK